MSRLPKRTNGPIRALLNDVEPPGTETSVQMFRNDVVTNGPLKLLRFPDVRERTGLSRTTIWRLERAGAFPKHHRISANTVGWVESEITMWIQSRIAEVAV